MESTGRDSQAPPVQVSHSTKLAERMGLITGATATMLLCMSVLFDFMFCVGLGLRLAELPTSIGDHVRSAIVWAPPLAISIALVFSFDLFRRRIEFTILMVKGGWSRRGLILAMILGLGVGIVEDLVPARVSGYVLVIVVGMWLLLAASILRLPRIQPNLSGWGRVAFMVVPAFAALVAWAGYTQAERMLLAEKSKWEVTLQDGEKRRDITLAGMRRFQDVAVLVDMERRVYVVPGAAIVAAKRSEVEPLPMAALCVWLSVGC